MWVRKLKLKELTPDVFKYLISLKGLTTRKVTDIGSRILMQLEKIEN